MGLGSIGFVGEVQSGDERKRWGDLKKGSCWSGGSAGDDAPETETLLRLLASPIKAEKAMPQAEKRFNPVSSSASLLLLLPARKELHEHSTILNFR